MVAMRAIRDGRTSSFRRHHGAWSLLLPRLPSLLIAVLVGAGCAGPAQQSATSTPGSVRTPQPTGGPGYAVAVILNGSQIASLTVADLSKLPQLDANVAGTEEHGPTLLAALTLAGVKEFNQVTAYGYTKGRLATAELVLKRDQVTDGVMLALVTRGTVKLTGPDIGAQKAIIDLNKLVVQ